jgi:hypothetical protein
VHYHIKPLVLIRRLKVACNQIELGISRCEVMLTALVSAVQAGPARVVVDIDEVEAVTGLGCVSQVAQPLAVCGGIGWEVENYSDASLQQINHQRTCNVPKLAGKTNVVGN